MIGSASSDKADLTLPRLEYKHCSIYHSVSLLLARHIVDMNIFSQPDAREFTQKIYWSEFEISLSDGNTNVTYLDLNITLFNGSPVFKFC